MALEISSTTCQTETKKHDTFGLESNFLGIIRKSKFHIHTPSSVIC